MSHVGTGYDINQTFVVEPLDNNIPILSACTALYTNNILSCSGDTQIFLDNGVITFDGNLYTSNDLTANTINASTYYSGGTNLIDIINLKNITGGTFNNTTDTLTLYKQNNSTVVVTGFTDYYTTGATLIGNTVYFNRNDVLSAYTLNLSNFSADTYVTGVTFSSNQLIIGRNDGVNLNTFINTFTGLTINGVLNANSIYANTISATTVSASTFYGDGSNLTGLVTQDTYVTGGTYSSGTAIFTNNTGGTFSVTGFSTNTATSFTGGTVSGSTVFTNGLTANTVSATTYYNLPLDIHVTGFTFNNGNYNITINQNDGTSYTQSLSTLASDITITGGTYNPVTGVATFVNNTGGTFSVTGFLTGYTDTTISAFTYDNANTFKIDSTNGESFSATINSVTGLTVNGSLSATTYLGLPIDVRVTGGTYNNGTATFTNNTGGTFTVTGLTIPFTGGTVSGNTIFTNGLTATTVSATTYLNTPYWESGSTGSYTIKAKNNSSIDATGDYSLAEGYATTASGVSSHAEGQQSTASGEASHAEGYATTASGLASHAEGNSTTASGQASHAEGFNTLASVNYSHAEGERTTASGEVSHAEGYQTTASGQASHAEGYVTTASGLASHAEGEKMSPTSNHIANGIASHVEGGNTVAYSHYSHAEGTNNLAIGIGTHVEGYNNKAGSPIYPILTYVANQITLTNDYTTEFSVGDVIGLIDSAGESLSYGLTREITWYTVDTVNYMVGPDETLIEFSPSLDAYTSNPQYVINLTKNESNIVSAHAEGSNTTASGAYSHAEGASTTASGDGSHAEGGRTIASGEASHAEGNSTTASGNYSHAEGASTTASGLASHAEGGSTTASGEASHAEGKGTTASGDYSHAEGASTTAIGTASHAEGNSTIAFGTASHAGGSQSVASGNTSFVHGNNSQALGNGTVVFGTTITGTTDNTVYVPYFNIKYLSGGTSVNNLGIDANGYVVAGTTSGGGTFTGGTVTGPTSFTNGLTANTISATTITTPSVVINPTGLRANTLSATTYLNLPTDIRVTGGTYSNGNATFTNNTGGTFSVSGFVTGNTYINKATSGFSTITGVGSGISYSYQIPAGTIVVGDTPTFTETGAKTGTAGICTTRIYVNTSNSISGAQLLATYQSLNTALYTRIIRTFGVESATITNICVTTTSTLTDVVASIAAISVLNINWTVAQWIIVHKTNAGADTSTTKLFQFYK